MSLRVVTKNISTVGFSPSVMLLWACHAIQLRSAANQPLSAPELNLSAENQQRQEEVLNDTSTMEESHELEGSHLHSLTHSIEVAPITNSNIFPRGMGIYTEKKHQKLAAQTPSYSSEC